MGDADATGTADADPVKSGMGITVLVIGATIEFEATPEAVGKLPTVEFINGYGAVAVMFMVMVGSGA
jgi:hypothetical protein